MIYIDSSWLMRVLLRQGEVVAPPSGSKLYSSSLLYIECRRTLDRHLQRGLISNLHYVNEGRALKKFIEGIELINLSQPILQRAAESFAMPIATLDALHLASAMLLRDALEQTVHFATFDKELALVAMAHGFEVIER